MTKILFFSLSLFTMSNLLFAQEINIYTDIKLIRCITYFDKLKITFDTYRNHGGLALRYSVADHLGVVKADFFVSRARFETNNSTITIRAKDIDPTHYKDREKIKLIIKTNRSDENGKAIFYEGKSEINNYPVLCRTNSTIKAGTITKAPIWKFPRK